MFPQIKQSCNVIKNLKNSKAIFYRIKLMSSTNKELILNLKSHNITIGKDFIQVISSFPFSFIVFIRSSSDIRWNVTKTRRIVELKKKTEIYEENVISHKSRH